MNRKEFFMTFPEAKVAFKAGTEWEYVPEYADFGDDYFELRLDCREYPDGHWMQKSYHLGYRVADGKIWCDEWRQRDGDWEVTDCFELKNNSDSKWYDQYYKESQESRKHYYEWVVEHKEDPLSAFYVSKVNRGERTYKWVLLKLDNGFFVASVRRLDGRKWVPLSLEEQTAEVKGYVRPEDYTWRQLKRLAAKGTKRSKQKWHVERGVITITDTLWSSEPNPDYETQLVEAAKRALT